MGVATTAGASRRQSPRECLIELPFSRCFRKSWWLEWYYTHSKKVRYTGSTSKSAKILKKHDSKTFGQIHEV